MIGLIWAKLIGNETRLASYSMTTGAVLDMVAGKSVAIVGNARALGQTEQGADIDSADVVIRINGAPMPSVASHGTRTDWIAMSTPQSEETIAQRQPEICLWMTSKRRRLPWHLVSRSGFYLLPVARSGHLKRMLGIRPTTGLMAIDFVASSSAHSIHLYGFDFFASLSLSGNRSSADVPHDFVTEKAFVDALIAKDKRITLHSMD